MVILYIYLIGLVLFYGPAYLFVEPLLTPKDPEEIPTCIAAFGIAFLWFAMLPLYLSYRITKYIYENYYK